MVKVLTDSSQKIDQYSGVPTGCTLVVLCTKSLLQYRVASPSTKLNPLGRYIAKQVIWRVGSQL